VAASENIIRKKHDVLLRESISAKPCDAVFFNKWQIGLSITSELCFYSYLLIFKNLVDISYLSVQTDNQKISRAYSHQCPTD